MWLAAPSAVQLLGNFVAAALEAAMLRAGWSALQIRRRTTAVASAASAVFVVLFGVYHQQNVVVCIACHFQLIPHRAGTNTCACFLFSHRLVRPRRRRRQATVQCSRRRACTALGGPRATWKSVGQIPPCSTGSATPLPTRRRLLCPSWRCSCAAGPQIDFSLLDNVPLNFVSSVRSEVNEA